MTAPSLDLRPAIIALLCALGTLWLTTADNRFPASYHPDEPSKARQVLEGEFNFHHPMLLLSTSRALAAATGADDVQQVTVTGRWTSALFTAGAVFLLVLLAGLLAGPLASAIAGALLVFNHQLFELAHYFKEDPALLLGLSASFLALVLFDRRPTLARAALLGAALALATSGKYLGATIIPFGAFLLWRHREALPILRGVSVALVGYLVVLALVNFPALAHPAGFAGGLAREVDFAVSGHKGITRDVPHGVYWKVFLDSTMPVRWLPAVGLLLIVYYADLVRRRRHAPTAEWLLAIYPIALSLVLSFSPKTHHRYFLPVTALALALAAVGAVRLPALLAATRPHLARFGAPVATALVAIALAAQAPTFAAYFLGFAHDGRQAMAEYLKVHVPPGTVIVQDKRVDLDALHLPYTFRGKLFAADEGRLADLRAAGVRWIAVAEGDYGRFFLKDHHATADGGDDYARRRQFYEELFATGELVLQTEPGRLQYLQPRLRLYRLPAESRPAP